MTSYCNLCTRRVSPERLDAHQKTAACRRTAGILAASKFKCDKCGQPMKRPLSSHTDSAPCKKNQKEGTWRIDAEEEPERTTEETAEKDCAALLKQLEKELERISGSLRDERARMAELEKRMRN